MDKRIIQKEYFLPEELQGEKIINYIRLALVFLFPALLLVIISNNNWILSLGNKIVITGILIGGLYSFGLFYFLNPRRYFTSIRFISPIFESLLITTVVFSGAFDLSASAGTIFIVNTYSLYLLFTGISVLRFSFLASACSGFCNALGYSFLIYWAAEQSAFSGVYANESTNQIIRFSLDNEILKVIFLLLMGIIAGYATRRNKRLLSLYIGKKKELDEINFKLEETIELRTKELTSKQKLLEKELDMARDLQQILLPQELPTSRDFKISATYIPMDKVGGDFYDVFVLENGKWGIFVCDVSGHGVPAAFIASMVKMSLEEIIRDVTEPSEVLAHINQKLLGRIGKNFVTAFYAIFDPITKEFEFANAGHIFPIHISSLTKDQTLLTCKGILLGFQEKTKFENNRVTLKPTDRVVIYTDGITEARNESGELYGEERLIEFLQMNHIIKDRHLMNGILEDVQKFSQKLSYDDDITIVVLEGN